MLALIPALVLAASLGGDPAFLDATEKVKQGDAAAAVPALQSLMGKTGLTDAERAEVQLWLATAYAKTGDPLRMRGHVQRAVTLDPEVRAPPAATPEVLALLEELRPAPEVPWIESSAGVVTVTGAGVVGLSALLFSLVMVDLVVTNQWLDGWYDSLDQSREVASPRAYADFLVNQNERYSRVREGARGDIGVASAAALLGGVGGTALVLAGVLSLAGEAE